MGCALASETFGAPVLDRIAKAVFVALGRTVLTEAEREALWWRQRDSLRPGEIPNLRSVHGGDFDGVDAGDPE